MPEMPDEKNNQKETIEVPPEEPRDVQVVERPKAPMEEQETLSTRRGNIMIGTLNVFNAPIKRFIQAPLRERYDRHYHSRHKHGRKHLVADILLALAILVLLGVNVYAFFFAQGPSLARQVSLATAVTPSILRSGDLATMTITYANESDRALVDATLSFRCPLCSAITGVTPEGNFNEKLNTFSLGTIAPHANGKVIVNGNILGSLGEEEKLTVALSYGVEGTERRETKAQSFPLRIQESALALEIRLPETIVHEGIVSFSILYENRGKRDLVQPSLEPSFGATFQLLESSLPLRDGKFVVATIPPQGRGEITGRLKVFGGGESEQMFGIQGFLGEEARSQGEVKRTVVLLYPKLAMTPVLRDDRLGSFVLGEDSALTFQYTNDEETDIVEFRLSVFPSEKLFVSEAKEMTERLAVVRKGGSGTITIPLRLRETLDRREAFGDGDPIVRLPYTIRYRLASRPDREIVIDRVDERRVVTDLSLDAFGRYFTIEGDQLGRGPLPPTIGETTRYWIFVPLKNSFSPLEDVVVSAHLPDAVQWTGKTSVTLGDPMKFDDRTRTLLWRVGGVTEFTGGIYPDVGVAFEVSFTPTSEHVGRDAVLLDTIVVRGKDTFTGVMVERRAGEVTTNLEVDGKARGKGKVVP